ASAGNDIAVTGPAELVLDGSASRDPEGAVLNYSWTQLSGPKATLSDANQAKAKVSVDAVSQDVDLMFELTVTDDHNLSAKDQLVVTNKAPQPNLPPVVTVQDKVSVEAGKQVAITANASDPNGDTLSYQWSVPAGLISSGQNSKTLVVTGPNVTVEAGYDLTVTVTDGALDAQAKTRLTVTPVSGGGDCNATDPDAANWPAWKAATTYSGGEKVSHNQLVWRAKYWSRGNEPTPGADQWQLESKVELGWDTAAAYNGGDLVNHGGRRWQAKWWNQGNEPGKSGVWLDIGVASCP
ncbi:MAG: hypothetical protein RLZZ616_45, partial [Pseudomonadota bacterium]